MWAAAPGAGKWAGGSGQQQAGRKAGGDRDEPRKGRRPWPQGKGSAYVSARAQQGGLDFQPWPHAQPRGPRG